MSIPAPLPTAASGDPTTPLAWIGGTETMAALEAVIERWPGWLLLVDAQRRVRARSAALAQAIKHDPRASGLASCTEVLETAGSNRCCLDLVLNYEGGARAALIQSSSVQRRPLPLVASLAPLTLPGGDAAWLIDLNPYDARAPLSASLGWHDVLASLRAKGADDAHWLSNLALQWVHPLVHPQWSGWVQEAGEGMICNAGTGRLPAGVSEAMICRQVSAVRTRVAHGLPISLPAMISANEPTDQLLHLIPAGLNPGWVLVLMGGQLSQTLAAMLCGLVQAAQSEVDSHMAVARFDAATFDHGQASDLLCRLSAREAEIARYVATGLPDKSIARHLGLSFHTVRNHLRHIMAKLGIHTRTQLAVALKDTDAARPCEPAAHLQRLPQ